MWLLQWPQIMQQCKTYYKWLEIWNTNSTWTVFFFSWLLNNIHMKAINCCGILRPNWKVMLSNSGRKLRLKQSAIKTMVKNDLAAAAWKDKWNINILKNMHHPPAEGNFWLRCISNYRHSICDNTCEIETCNPQYPKESEVEAAVTPAVRKLLSQQQHRG
jgi:hypothetical protein